MIRMPGSGGVLDQLAKAIEDHFGLAREAKDEALKFVDKVEPLVKAGMSYICTQILLQCTLDIATGLRHGG